MYLTNTGPELHSSPELSLAPSDPEGRWMVEREKGWGHCKGLQLLIYIQSEGVLEGTG